MVEFLNKGLWYGSIVEIFLNIFKTAIFKESRDGSFRISVVVESVRKSVSELAKETV